MSEGGRCKGAWGIGNNCGRCGHCKETCHEAVGVIHELRRQMLEAGRGHRTLEESCRRLAESLKGDGNALMVGTGEGRLIIYVMRRLTTCYPAAFDGWPVSQHVTGNVVPA